MGTDPGQDSMLVKTRVDYECSDIGLKSSGYDQY